MIRNLIFDVGDVLISYRWYEMLTEDYGMDHKRAMTFGAMMFMETPWWKDMDAGLLTMEQAIGLYSERFPDYEADIRWFLTHVELMPVHRPEIWEKIARLKEMGYKTYILSNYSEFMFKTHTDGLPFWDSMDGSLVSYEIHKIKPDMAIYKALLDRYDLSPEECFFFDDRKENIEGGQKAGIDGFVVTSRQALGDYLDHILASPFGRF